MAYIPDEKIDEIRAASDIADVVSDYVRLKKQGSNLFGLCPFHNEKSPSFSVNPRMGIFKCFGCGEGGDVFSFISKIEMVPFPEAAEILADRAGIEIARTERDRERASEADAIYEALRIAARFFYFTLTEREEGEKALAYVRNRGFTDATIKKFGIGYAPDRWDGLIQHAESKHISAEQLEKAGLVIPRKNADGYYDRFRGRVMFPIFSHIGKVVGFGGRILDADVDQPKYINSPETNVYHKSRVLYGLSQAKQAIRDLEEVILVEGYTDVVALHQAGVEHVVASSGTSLTEGQASVLNRYAQRVVLLYDADEAGVTATLRGIRTLLEEGLAAYSVALPSDEDPDSYVQQHGADAFRTYVKRHRRDFIEFMVDVARREGRMDTPEGAAKTMREVLAAIARVPDDLLRETYLKRASTVLDVPEGRLHRVMNEQRSEHERKSSSRRAPIPPPVEEDTSNESTSRKAPASDPSPPEELLISLMLQHGKRLIEYVMGHMAVEEFTAGPARDIVEALLEMYRNDDIRTHRFTDGTFEGPMQRLATRVLADRYVPSSNWKDRKGIHVPEKNEDPFGAASDAMMRLKKRRVDEALEEARDEQKQYEEIDDQEEVRRLQKKVTRLVRIKQKVQNKAFIRDDLRR